MPPRRSKRAEALRIVPPDRHRHGEAMCDMIAKVFGGGRGYYPFRDFCRRVYVLPSHYDWRASRIGLIGNRLVTHFGVWDIRVRVGTARVRVGGIGAVATHGDYRMRGYMARTARVSVAAMRDGGYDLSMLAGISDFYHRFGYVRAWCSSIYTVTVSDLPAERPTGRVRRFTPGHREDITRLYNREHAHLTGTAVKPTYPRGTYPRPMEGYRWTDARGRTVGYLLLRPDKNLQCADKNLQCVEAAGNPDQALRALAGLARRRGFREVTFDTLHDRCRLIRRVRQGTCRVETRHLRSGGDMVATINLAATLDKMTPELGRRLRASPLENWRGKLVVADRRETVTLRIDRSRVGLARGGRSRHAIRGGDAIAQLLIGTNDPAVTLETARMRVTGDAGRLADVLFPNEHPMLSLRDRF